MTLTDEKGLTIHTTSRVEHDGTVYTLALAPDTGAQQLAVWGNTSGFDGLSHAASGALLCPLNAENAAALRARLPWMNPVPLGLRTSAGFGDRLGSATPGHAMSLAGTQIAPIFAQQSVRENARTGRTPQIVVDDAMWGAFRVGWREAWGADADHLKALDVIAPFIAAGYSFFTIDPSDHVDNDAESDAQATLEGKMAQLPWRDMGTSWEDLSARLLGKSFDLGTQSLTFDTLTLLRAAAKYGAAIPFIKTMYDTIKAQMGDCDFDFEVSVDETDTPTSLHEHIYIATEMQRLGIVWHSLAPRFVGRFEKGVDYIGDLDALDANLAGHAAIMQQFGPYKLSLHSGSDKFTVYPLATRHAQGYVHLKTAGTSYLEALRVWAQVDPAAFRDVLDFSRSRYETDRATYHVSAELAKVPSASKLADSDLPGLLDQFDARQVLHVTYGSVLDRYGDQLHAMIAANEALYHNTIKRHFVRHIEPFS